MKDGDMLAAFSRGNWSPAQDSGRTHRFGAYGRRTTMRRHLPDSLKGPVRTGLFRGPPRWVPPARFLQDSIWNGPRSCGRMHGSR